MANCQAKQGEQSLIAFHETGPMMEELANMGRWQWSMESSTTTELVVFHCVSDVGLFRIWGYDHK